MPTVDGDKKSIAGRKPMNALVMFRLLVVRSLYNLSDEQAEYEARDRLSFARFLARAIVKTTSPRIDSSYRPAPRNPPPEGREQLLETGLPCPFAHCAVEPFPTKGVGPNSLIALSWGQGALPSSLCVFITNTPMVHVTPTLLPTVVTSVGRQPRRANNRHRR
jgi:hypothetical protein